MLGLVNSGSDRMKSLMDFGIILGTLHLRPWSLRHGSNIRSLQHSSLDREMYYLANSAVIAILQYLFKVSERVLFCFFCKSRGWIKSEEHLSHDWLLVRNQLPYHKRYYLLLSLILPQL